MDRTEFNYELPSMNKSEMEHIVREVDSDEAKDNSLFKQLLYGLSGLVTIYLTTLWVMKIFLAIQSTQNNNASKSLVFASLSLAISLCVHGFMTTQPHHTQRSIWLVLAYFVSMVGTFVLSIEKRWVLSLVVLIGILMTAHGIMLGYRGEPKWPQWTILGMLTFSFGGIFSSLIAMQDEPYFDACTGFS